VLSQIHADGRVTFLNDGKLTSFDAAIKELLPPLEDLLASVFASQGKNGAFSDLDRKGRRQLFASLLGLDRYQQLAERATQAAARLARESEVLIAQRDVLARSATAEIESSLEERAQQLHVEAGSVDVCRATLSNQIAEGDAKLVALGDAMELHAKAVAEVARLEAEQRAQGVQRDATATALTRLDADLAQERALGAAALEAALRRLKSDEADPRIYETEIRQIEARRQKAVEDATAKIAANEGLKQDADAIRAAVARLTAIDAEVDEIHKMSLETQGRLQGRQARERVILDAMAVIREREAELVRAEQDAAAISAAPFGKACAPCQFMTTAATAMARIPSLQEAVASRTAAEEELTAVRALIAPAEIDIRSFAAGTAALRAERDGLKDKVSLLPHLTAAEERIAAHQKRKTDAEADATRDLAEAAHRRDQRVLRLRAEQANRKDEHTAAVSVLEERTAARRLSLHEQGVSIALVMDRLESSLVVTRPQVTLHAEAADKAREQQSLLTVYRREWDATTATRARVEAQVAELGRQQYAYGEAKAALEAVHARVEALQEDVVEWTLLAKSLGRDGIQTLEIDAAGPTVSAYCNDLLQSCYGGWFTVELVTQEEKASKGKDGSTHKEVFELKVYDQTRGGQACDLTDLSGGEKVIVEEAFRCAIALLINTKSRVPMRTMFRDETTGALDSENAAQYVTLLRRVQQIGGFERIIFISHNEDVKAMADAQVQVADGDFVVALPPFVHTDNRQLVEA